MEKVDGSIDVGLWAVLALDPFSFDPIPVNRADQFYAVFQVVGHTVASTFAWTSYLSGNPVARQKNLYFYSNKVHPGC